MEPKDTPEFRDLDYLATTEEVQTAVKEMLSNTDDVWITLINPNSRGLKLVIAQLNHHQALKLLETARIKIGWTSSRIRRGVDCGEKTTNEGIAQTTQDILFYPQKSTRSDKNTPMTRIIQDNVHWSMSPDDLLDQGIDGMQRR